MTLYEIQKHKQTYTRKIYNGVCGSKHTIKTGVVYDSDADARVKLWVKFGALQQDATGMFDKGTYMSEGADEHKVRLKVERVVDGTTYEVHDIILSGTPDGDSKIYFDIIEPGKYIISAFNEATGNCSGGRCEFGTETVSGFFGDEQEISTCWYSPRFYLGNISQEEIDRIDVDRTSQYIQEQTGNPQGYTPPSVNIVGDEKQKKLVYGGMALASLVAITTLLR
tara:strand:+ start:49 stop:720 length:672 start_codon:yes stop_codon:yes gene_type:complete